MRRTLPSFFETQTLKAGKRTEETLEERSLGYKVTCAH